MDKKGDKIKVKFYSNLINKVINNLLKISI